MQIWFDRDSEDERMGICRRNVSAAHMGISDANLDAGLSEDVIVTGELIDVQIERDKLPAPAAGRTLRC